MKKIVFVLLLVLVTGCTRIDNEEDYKKIVDSIAYSSNTLNTATTGYKYYLPKSVRIDKDLDFNQELVVLNTKMYLYVDIVSYYYKNFTNNDDDENYNYYYEKINNNNGDFGYIAINKEDDDKYFLKIVYNYAKIEVYTTKNNLSSIVSYATLILKSIDYNDSVIAKFISDNNVTSNDTLYNIKKPSDSESKFSQYLQEYVHEEEQIIVLPEE